MRAHVDEEEICMTTVAVANGECLAVWAERKRAHGSYDRAHIGELRGTLETWPGLPQRACVEEGHAAVVAADGKRAAVWGERVVEDARAADV